MNLESVLSEVQTIGISGHVRPDGDCVGACLGLYNYIKVYHPEKEVVVYLEKMAEKFQFLSGANDIRHEAEEKVYDIYFALDCASSERLGFAGVMYEKAAKQGCVDHHVSNQGGGAYTHIVSTASSTCELVYDLIGTEKVTKEIAECLYVGLSHDTGVFQYSNVAPSTMRAAACLLETGIEAHKIIVETYCEKTHLQNQMIGKAFFEGQLLLDGRCIAYGLSWDEMQKYGVGPLDLDAIASQLRNTQGVDIALFMYALDPEEYKVSLRANDRIDASIIATHFQGGGHKRAAGFSLKGEYPVLRDRIVEEIKKQY